MINGNKTNLNLYDQLKQRGLEKTISLTPDLSYWLDLWYNQSIADLHDVFEQYEFHWYVNEVNLKMEFLKMKCEC